MKNTPKTPLETLIVDSVFATLRDRKGFDDWWDGIDRPIAREIKAELLKRVRARTGKMEAVIAAAREHYTASQIIRMDEPSEDDYFRHTEASRDLDQTLLDLDGRLAEPK